MQMITAWLPLALRDAKEERQQRRISRHADRASREQIGLSMADVGQVLHETR